MSEYDTWAARARGGRADRRARCRETGKPVLGIDSSPAMLEVEALYGGFEHEPLDDASLEFVYVTRKP